MTDDWKPEICGLCHQPIRGNGITISGGIYYHPGCAKHRAERAAESSDGKNLLSLGDPHRRELGRG
jgi:hypothetical protein